VCSHPVYYAIACKYQKGMISTIDLETFAVVDSAGDVKNHGKGYKKVVGVEKAGKKNKKMSLF